MTEATESSPAQSETAAGAPAQAGDARGYAVLARKYRPRTFEALIGQQAMVRTLKNAFESGRIAPAYMLTGVRGVGKTTTARILARALNYEGPGVEGPTTQLGEDGPHCAAIMESRHHDVIEIDAASHTGVENIREIIDSVRYRPAYARTKVYIVDEVHMLSKAAFNALLKTLEEPPDHVKFIFATTEARKVPVTVLSRCQRFDLRRVDVEVLREHFAGIARKESIEIDDEALTLIARAAEGSVRDGLSLLDQASAHADGPVSGAHVRAMLGLADRSRVLDLLETVLKGDAGRALEGLRALYDDGAEPAQVLADMSEAVHVVTRMVAAGAEAADPTLSEAERGRAEALAGRLDMPALTRAWQMLLKGLDEAQNAPRPMAAAEMVLVRMCYLAEAPPPAELARRLDGAPETPAREGQPASAGDGAPAATAGAAPQGRAPRGDGGQAAALKAEEDEPLPDAAPAPEAALQPQAAALPESFEGVVALVEAHREVMLANALKSGVRLVSYAPPHIEISLVPGTHGSIANELREFLSRETGRAWVVAISDREGGRTIAEMERALAEEQEANRRAEMEALRNHPSVRAVLEHFPGAEITDVRPLGGNEDDGESRSDAL